MPGPGSKSVADVCDTDADDVEQCCGPCEDRGENASYRVGTLGQSALVSPEVKSVVEACGKDKHVFIPPF